MNYDFLQNYNIPIRNNGSSNQNVDAGHSTMEGPYGSYTVPDAQSTPTVNTAYYGYGYNHSYYSGTTNASDYYQSPERFIPPSKYGTGYSGYRFPFKRKSVAAGGGSAAKKEVPIAEISNDGKLVMFLGRDESYPDSLNSLIHPLSCDLCNVKMNSRAFAKDHYVSKAHDKHISAWLFKNYTEKGISPPSIKRFLKQGPTGPDAYYCEACDLKLTSLTHASQHYAGKKHRLVVEQRGKPSGAGFYSSEGKWVRTGTKSTSNASKDNRFGIGDMFQLPADLTPTADDSSNTNTNAINSKTVTSAADTTTKIESDIVTTTAEGTKKTPSVANLDKDPALFCSICKINVTSAVQMTMHLSGSKHSKKLRAASLSTISVDKNVELQTDITQPPIILDNVLLSAIKEEIKPNPADLSMYRTPSGQYYCKTCNTSMSNLSGLEQHLKGKRHLKKQTEEKAMTSLAAKKISKSII